MANVLHVYYNYPFEELTDKLFTEKTAEAHAAETGILEIEDLIKFDEIKVSAEKTNGEKFISAVDAEMADSGDEADNTVEVEEDALSEDFCEEDVNEDFLAL
jgi:hypothetical protein